GVVQAMFVNRLRAFLFTLAAVGLAALGTLAYRGTAAGPAAEPPQRGVVPRAVPPPPAEPEDEGEATYHTPNFAVTAPSRRVARQVAEAAEQHRKDVALLWLDRELPRWPQPCRVKVKLTLGSPASATSFQFADGRMMKVQDMLLEGPLSRIVDNRLPHEVTHTVFADHFRRPVPRWADEGAAVLSEDAKGQERHARDARQLLKTPDRVIPLR